MDPFDEREAAIAILDDLWSHITHTSPPYSFGGADLTERQALLGLCYLWDRLGFATDKMREEAESKRREGA